MINYYLKNKNLTEIEYSEFIQDLKCNQINFAFFDSALISLRESYTSGDLDLIISIKDKEKVLGIISDNNFKLYAEINTNQFLFVKLSSSGSLILIHIHFDLYFYGNKFFSFEEAYIGNNELKKEYQIYSMALFCMNKRRVRAFEKAYISECNHSDNKTIYSNLTNQLFKISYNISTTQKLKFFFKSNPLSFFLYSFKNIYSKFKSLIFSKNKHFVFVGVDGAGKSTLIDNVVNVIESKLVISKSYFGLKSSIANKYIGRSSHDLKKKSYRQSKINKRNTLKSLDIFSMGKSIFILIEYFFRNLILRLNFSRIPIVHLHDRSYIDRMFYDGNFLKNAYRRIMQNYTFIFVTGDIEILYQRKAEVPSDVMNKINKFYYKYSESLDKVVVINTTKFDEDVCNYHILKSIIDDLPDEF